MSSASRSLESAGSTGLKQFIWKTPLLPDGLFLSMLFIIGSREVH
jgi:hypothetical protein